MPKLTKTKKFKLTVKPCPYDIDGFIELYHFLKYNKTFIAFTNINVRLTPRYIVCYDKYSFNVVIHELMKGGVKFYV